MTEAQGGATGSLEVEGDALRSAMKMLTTHARSSKKGDAILRFSDGKLSIVLGGVEGIVAARGDWPGEARVSGVLMLGLASHPPPFSKIRIRVDGDSLDLAGTRMSCSWQKSGTSALGLPMNPSFLDVLRLGMENTDGALQESGILAQVKTARAKSESLIEQAARILDPLSVTADDLRVLVHLRVRDARQVPRS